MYYSVSEKFITETIDIRLSEHISNSCYNLSAILADVDGKVTQSMVRLMMRGLEITPPGILVAGQYKFETPEPGLFEQAYRKDISTYAYLLYSELRKGNTDLMIVDGGKAVISSLIEISHKEVPQLRNMMSCLYLELLAIYFDLLEATYESGMKRIGVPDLDRVLNNLRWISNIIEDSTSRPYTLIEIIRDCQRVVAEIRSKKILFDTIYINKLSDISGGDEVE